MVVFRRVDRRIADYLQKRCKDGTQPVRATHQAIASDLGTSREVVSRILKEFESEGIIEVARGTVTIVDPARLEERGIDR
jgi:CRP/FNR family transcriptional regulator